MDVKVAFDRRARRAEYERAGFWFAFGVAKYVWLFLLAVVLIGAALAALGLRDADATDASVSVRSGVRLRTDYGTGCQYLEARGGGITPRLDADGRQMCGGR